MEQQGKKGFAIAGMILGIVACVIAWWGLVYGIIGIACGVVGLILSLQAKKSYTALGQKSGMATAGLILSIIGLVLAVIGTIACGICAAAVASSGLTEVTEEELAGALTELSSALD